MGWFDFVKEAGRKLGIGDKPATPDVLRQEIDKLGLGLQDADISVEGDIVRVLGKAKSQEEHEKIVLALGNVHGIARVDDQIAVVQAATAAVAAPESKFYRVKKGDTLSKIAKEFYGDANRYQLIFEANRPMLEHPDKIYPGQSLRIPAMATA
jgi:nucleoid-associated protein YgaU